MTDGRVDATRGSAAVGDRRRIRLLYLTCTEIIADYGIFDTQVRSLLATLARDHAGALSVRLLSLMPVLRFVKWRVEVVFRRHRDALRRLRGELAESGVEARIGPLLSAYPLDSWRPAAMAVAVPGAIVLLGLHLARHRIDVLHCRSYHAGLLGLLMNRLLRVPYVFDPRALWTEEQILSRRWRRGSIPDRVWRRLTVAIARRAHACIVVSEPMREAFAPHARRVEVMYPVLGEAHLAEPTGATGGAVDGPGGVPAMFVFAAASLSAWSSAEHLMRRYDQLGRLVPDSALLVITRTAREAVLAAARAHGIDTERVTVCGLSSERVPAALRTGRFGLLVRPRTPQSPIELPVKLPEYLAAGLPVICDEYIGGAARLIREHGVGLLLSDDWSRNAEALAALEASYDQVSRRCRVVARRLFDVEAQARRCARLYEDAVRHA